MQTRETAIILFLERRNFTFSIPPPYLPKLLQATKNNLAITSEGRTKHRKLQAIFLKTMAENYHRASMINQRIFTFLHLQEI